ncbi:MAG: RagB/SusD family nutrient uptake outer membrane protein [Dysgonomonas sp.]
MWDNKCTPVYTTGLAIAGLEANTEDPDKVKTLLGEASFFRGMLMYELSMLWGEIPIWDKKRESELGYRRQPLKDVWEYIINDFNLQPIIFLKNGRMILKR